MTSQPVLRLKGINKIINIAYISVMILIYLVQDI